MSRTLRERFEEKYTPEPMSGCWLWTACSTKKGYGRFAFNNKNCSAHRVSWEIHNGPIPGNMYVLHKCDVRSCVNPYHLFLGTQADNMADMVAKGRSHDGKGERNQNAKLTKTEALEIYNASGVLREIANRYGTSISNVHGIKIGQRWAHVTNGKKNEKRNI